MKFLFYLYPAWTVGYEVRHNVQDASVTYMRHEHSKHPHHGHGKHHRHAHPKVDSESETPSRPKRHKHQQPDQQKNPDEQVDQKQSEDQQNGKQLVADDQVQDEQDANDQVLDEQDADDQVQDQQDAEHPHTGATATHQVRRHRISEGEFQGMEISADGATEVVKPSMMDHQKLDIIRDDSATEQQEAPSSKSLPADESATEQYLDGKTTAESDGLDTKTEAAEALQMDENDAAVGETENGKTEIVVQAKDEANASSMEDSDSSASYMDETDASSGHSALEDVEDFDSNEDGESTMDNDETTMDDDESTMDDDDSTVDKNIDADRDSTTDTDRNTDGIEESLESTSQFLTSELLSKGLKYNSKIGRQGSFLISTVEKKPKYLAMEKQSLKLKDKPTKLSLYVDTSIQWIGKNFGTSAYTKGLENGKSMVLQNVNTKEFISLVTTTTPPPSINNRNVFIPESLFTNTTPPPSINNRTDVLAKTIWDLQQQHSRQSSSDEQRMWEELKKAEEQQRREALKKAEEQQEALKKAEEQRMLEELKKAEEQQRRLRKKAEEQWILPRLSGKQSNSTDSTEESSGKESNKKIKITSREIKAEPVADECSAITPRQWKNSYFRLEFPSDGPGKCTKDVLWVGTKDGRIMADKRPKVWKKPSTVTMTHPNQMFQWKYTPYPNKDSAKLLKRNKRGTFIAIQNPATDRYLAVKEGRSSTDLPLVTYKCPRISFDFGNCAEYNPSVLWAITEGKNGGIKLENRGAPGIFLGLNKKGILMGILDEKNSTLLGERGESKLEIDDPEEESSSSNPTKSRINPTEEMEEDNEEESSSSNPTNNNGEEMDEDNEEESSSTSEDMEEDDSENPPKNNSTSMIQTQKKSSMKKSMKKWKKRSSTTEEEPCTNLFMIEDKKTRKFAVLIPSCKTSKVYVAKTEHDQTRRINVDIEWSGTKKLGTHYIVQSGLQVKKSNKITILVLFVLLVIGLLIMFFCVFLTAERDPDYVDEEEDFSEMGGEYYR